MFYSEIDTVLMEMIHLVFFNVSGHALVCRLLQTEVHVTVYETKSSRSYAVTAVYSAAFNVYMYTYISSCTHGAPSILDFHLNAWVCTPPFHLE